MTASDALRERIIVASILYDLPTELPPHVARVLEFAPLGWRDTQAGVIAAAIREALCGARRRNRRGGDGLRWRRPDRSIPRPG